MKISSQFASLLLILSIDPNPSPKEIKQKFEEKNNLGNSGACDLPRGLSCAPIRGSHLHCFLLEFPTPKTPFSILIHDFTPN